MRTFNVVFMVSKLNLILRSLKSKHYNINNVGQTFHKLVPDFNDVFII